MLQKIDPQVRQMITPIMTNMTSVHMAEKMQPVIGHTNNNDQTKRYKQECVHLIFEGNQPVCKLTKTSDGKLVCTACGREIYTKFDSSNVTMLLDARKVVEQVLFFGMVNNMKPEVVKACIFMKQMLPDLAQVAAELNEYVKREETNLDNVGNVGDEYRLPGITGGF